MRAPRPSALCASRRAGRGFGRLEVAPPARRGRARPPRRTRRPPAPGARPRRPLPPRLNRRGRPLPGGTACPLRWRAALAALRHWGHRRAKARPSQHVPGGSGGADRWGIRRGSPATPRAAPGLERPALNNDARGGRPTRASARGIRPARTQQRSTPSRAPDFAPQNLGRARQAAPLTAPKGDHKSV